MLPNQLDLLERSCERVRKDSVGQPASFAARPLRRRTGALQRVHCDARDTGRGRFRVDVTRCLFTIALHDARGRVIARGRRLVYPGRSAGLVLRGRRLQRVHRVTVVAIARVYTRQAGRTGSHARATLWRTRF